MLNDWPLGSIRVIHGLGPQVFPVGEREWQSSPCGGWEWSVFFSMIIMETQGEGGSFS